MQVMLGHRCDVVVVSTTAEALTAAERHTFDCAIIDWSMPESGQVLDASGEREAGSKAIIGLHQIDPDLSIIIWTAYGDNVNEIALAEGAYATMPKPIDIEAANDMVVNATVATRKGRAKRLSIANNCKPVA